ncbi:hypothetical protein [Pedobacter sp. R20-19]|uniref:hypothetical protein n=1 Tax=Pedobacter sp. R20-19 TaxID=1270196 RepID=UPI001E516C8F|nr:hypothetical protein [Pedobacter sp. R20-19]
MRNIIALMSMVLFTSLQIKTAYAQQEDARISIVLSVKSQGKTINTALNSVSTTLSRYNDETALSLPAKGKDSTSTKASMATSGYKPGIFYLIMDAKNLQDDMLKLLASKKITFDGTITITDSYGKIPTRTIKFLNGSLSSYSDQFSSTYYGDSIGNVSLSLNCTGLSINGVMLEQ